jgi:DNA-binding CsgD family transcriptional regulator
MSAAKNRVRDAVLDESHIRRLVGLIGVVSGLDVDLPQKRRLILEGVSRLIQADGWSWSLTEQSGRKTVMLDALSGGEKGLLLKRGIARYLKEPGPNGAERSSGKKARGRVGEISHSISDRSSKRGPVISIRELSGAVASHLCFVRAAGRPAFSPSEEEIVQILAEEIPWLHEVSPTCVSLQPEIHLSPREHEVFLLLGEGLKSKEISERLGISPHTVQDYVKSIYRAFGIRSRAEALKLVEVQIPQ